MLEHSWTEQIKQSLRLHDINWLTETASFCDETQPANLVALIPNKIHTQHNWHMDPYIYLNIPYHDLLQPFEYIYITIC
jgi:hypothetical protein